MTYDHISNTLTQLGIASTGASFDRLPRPRPVQPATAPPASPDRNRSPAISTRSCSS